MNSSPSLLDRDLLLDVAAHHYRQDGLFPVPGARGKRPALREYAAWARLARRGDRPEWRDIEQAFGADRVAGVGHLIIAGLCAVDVDGSEGEAVLVAGPVPDTAEVQTTHGRHLYFTGAKRLPSLARLGDKIELLGPGHYVELPPTSGKVWVRHVTGELPRLPRHLRELVKQQKIAAPTAATGAVPDTDAELAAWRELLPALRGNGPWRAKCPLHPDERESLSIYVGRKDGRLIGRCHAGCGAWTARGLRQRLGIRLTAQYTRAHEAITALGDSVDAPTRDALRWIVRQAETFGLDLSDREGLGASYRQMAAATGLSKVSDTGELSNKRALVRLYERLRALGVAVVPGQEYTPGVRGKATRLVLPRAWIGRWPQ